MSGRGSDSYYRGNKRDGIMFANKGKCAWCDSLATEIDHIIPVFQGGETSERNSMPLCSECHDSKVEAEWGGLRNGQSEALLKMARFTRGPQLVYLHPGQGKTRFAIEAIRMRKRIMPRGFYVVPTDQLRVDVVHSLRDAGHTAEIYENQHGFTEPEQIFVTTFANVNSKKDRIRAMCEQSETEILVILDEIHHSGEDKSWGSAVTEAFQAYTRQQIGMSGTPYRHDGRQIALFEQLEPTFKWTLKREYAQPMPCIEMVSFPVVTCNISNKYDSNDPVALNEWEKGMGAILSDFSSEDSYGPTACRLAIEKLDAARCSVADAGGLVNADSIFAAGSYASYLRAHGQDVTVLTQETKHSDQVLNAYRNGNGRFLVAVCMVSEGVDIPRLEVLVHASAKKTQQSFTQMVGRVIRTRPGIEGRCTKAIIPDHPAYTELAEKWEANYTPEIIERIELEESANEASSEKTMKDTLFALETMGAVQSSEIYGGDHQDLEDVQKWHDQLPASLRNAAPVVAATEKKVRAKEPSTVAVKQARVARPKSNKEQLRNTLNELRKPLKKKGVDYWEYYQRVADRAGIQYKSIENYAESELGLLVKAADAWARS